MAESEVSTAGNPFVSNNLVDTLRICGVAVDFMSRAMTVINGNVDLSDDEVWGASVILKAISKTMCDLSEQEEQAQLQRSRELRGELSSAHEAGRV